MSLPSNADHVNDSSADTDIVTLYREHMVGTTDGEMHMDRH